MCVITGASSGLGRQTTKQLLDEGNFHVICAVRDVEKMALVAEEEEFDPASFTVMRCDLDSFQSVRDFAAQLKEFKADKPLDRLVCNAAVYQPSLDYAKWSEDGIEQQLQTNFLSHFLLSSLLVSLPLEPLCQNVILLRVAVSIMIVIGPALMCCWCAAGVLLLLQLEDMRKAEQPRLIAVGSVTGNDNTVGGGGVYPIADLRDLQGLEDGARDPIAMIDGYNFNGAKAYKDSKLAVMMMTNILHDKYHRSTGITFSSIYPGCIAESPLFREKVPASAAAIALCYCHYYCY